MIFSPLRDVGRAMSFITRLIFVSMLVVIIAFIGYVLVKGSQPMGVVGADPNGESTVLSELNYWEFMANRLAVSSETSVNCHRTRLIYLAIALPVYPAVYTYVAIFPDSNLAHHTQPSPLIPDPISWKEAPETWWKLVKEISWMAFTEPQWDYTPEVGQKLRIDQHCVLPLLKKDDS